AASAADRGRDRRRDRVVGDAAQVAPRRPPARARAPGHAGRGRPAAREDRRRRGGAAPTVAAAARGRTVAGKPPRILGAEDIAAVLTFPALVEALRDAFCGDITVPLRHHHTVPQPGEAATLLLMPAWTVAGDAAGRFLGCKIVTIFPDNAAARKPSLHGQYLLMSGATGEPLALMDARALTAWRTAAAS